MTAAALWGLIGPFAVWAAAEGLTATQTAFWRTAGSALPFALLAGSRLRMPAPTLGRSAVFGVVGIATMYVAFFVAVERVGVGVAAVLLYTGPAWVAVWEWIGRRRRPATMTVVALVLAVAGAVLVSYLPEQVGRLDGLGVLAALLSGLSYSTQYTLGRRLYAEHDPAAILCVAMVVASIVIAPLARPTLPGAGAVWPLLYLSLIATFLTTLLFARGVVRVAPVRAAIVATIEPLVALIASALVLGATMHAQQMVGAALILVGVTLVVAKRESGVHGAA